MSKSKLYPKTSCSSPGEYERAYESSENCFVITISSHLSGSHNSAVAGAELAKEKRPGKFVHVFDTLSASAGEVLVALKIKEFINNHLPKDVIIKKTNDFIKGMQTLFVLENLENLIKAGRMSKVMGMIASVLSFRPILGSDGAGQIKLFDRVRGMQNALKRLIGLMGERCKDFSERTLVIAHCNCLQRAIDFKNDVLKKYVFRDVRIVEMGGLSTVYANEGGLVIAF